MVPFQSEIFKAAIRCVLTLCSTFQYAKAHRKPTKGSIKAINPDIDGAIHFNQPRAGNMVSVDHFESRFKGHT